MKTDSLFDLTGKVAVVTGGGDGIGKASCKILAAAGASVVVSNRSFEKARLRAEEIVSDGGKAVPVACDVSVEADLVNLVDFAVKT